ncbi:OmpA family protein [Parvularcula sp. ZS-1/3]|uniref:OmpA family protein n=1 Tax=Parvularcula mediterranea TaxID=2732508 RepID=A0A7Y3RPC1_9PROT|nr:OmpA family protein [Parvularcula mediterranea]NNU17695.1 OmpA family protein [Parvularcula mediterranea]
MLSILATLALTLSHAAQSPEGALVFSAEDFETTVYFDYGRNDLGSAGILLVQQQAERALAAGFAKAKVIGHTDRAGSAEQNLKDGMERAEAVAAVLVSQGYAEDDVEVESAGESQPARRHADERREPLNRRAVIIFSE